MHKFTEIDTILASFNTDGDRQRFLELVLDPNMVAPDWSLDAEYTTWHSLVFAQLRLIWGDLTTVARALVRMDAEELLMDMSRDD